MPGWISNLELMWDEPAHAHVLDRFASFSRLILFDKRGTGLSDPVPLDRLPTLEERMDDVRAVLDAVECEQPAVFGFSEGGNDERALRGDLSRTNEGARPLRRVRQADLEPRLPVGAEARRSGT